MHEIVHHRGEARGRVPGATVGHAVDAIPNAPRLPANRPPLIEVSFGPVPTHVERLGGHAWAVETMMVAGVPEFEGAVLLSAYKEQAIARFLFSYRRFT